MVRAAFFDLDKTILDTSSNVALSGPFIEAGLLNRRTALTSVLVQLPYLLAGADESRMEQMAQALGRMGRGWNAAFLEATVEDALERTIQPVCYAQALARIEAHKRAGDVVVIASASVEQVVRPIAKMLGADEVLSSRAAVDEDGCFTGEITHFNQAQGKADACEALARSHGWDLSECSAYSDSVSDAPLLRLVGHPYAVNPARDGAARRLAHPHVHVHGARPAARGSHAREGRSAIHHRRRRWRGGLRTAAPLRNSPRRDGPPARGGRHRARPGCRRRLPRSNG